MIVSTVEGAPRPPNRSSPCRRGLLNTQAQEVQWLDPGIAGAQIQPHNAFIGPAAGAQHQDQYAQPARKHQ